MDEFYQGGSEAQLVVCCLGDPEVRRIFWPESWCCALQTLVKISFFCVFGMAAMPIPLWCSSGSKGDSLAWMIFTVILLSCYPINNHSLPSPAMISLLVHTFFARFWCRNERSVSLFISHAVWFGRICSRCDEQLGLCICRCRVKWASPITLQLDLKTVER